MSKIRPNEIRQIKPYEIPFKLPSYFSIGLSGVVFSAHVESFTAKTEIESPGRAGHSRLVSCLINPSEIYCGDNLVNELKTQKLPERCRLLIIKSAVSRNVQCACEALVFRKLNSSELSESRNPDILKPDQLIYLAEEVLGYHERELLIHNETAKQDFAYIQELFKQDKNSVKSLVELARLGKLPSRVFIKNRDFQKDRRSK